MQTKQFSPEEALDYVCDFVKSGNAEEYTTQMLEILHAAMASEIVDNQKLERANMVNFFIQLSDLFPAIETLYFLDHNVRE